MAVGRGLSLAVILSLLATTSRAQQPIPDVAGCFSTSTPLESAGSYTNSSIPVCNDVCQAKNKYVFAVHDLECFCGDKLPPADAQVGSRFCNIQCPGNAGYFCGGTLDGADYYTTWITNIKPSVPNFSSSTSKTSTATSAARTTKSTGGNGSPTGSAGQGSGSSGSDTNSANKSSGNGGDQDLAIALGVILGVLALALMGLLFWCTSRRRKRTGSYNRRFRSSYDSSDALKSGTGSGSPQSGPEMAEAAGPAVLVAPASRAPPEYFEHRGATTPGSRGSWENDSFYTPAEGVYSGLYSNQHQNQYVPDGRKSYADEEADQLGELEAIRRPDPIASRTHMPSSREADAFDFAHDGTMYRT